MKRVIARATFWVMCLFAYLILSIQFYQNAMAEEIDQDKVEGLAICSGVWLNVYVDAEKRGDFEAVRIAEMGINYYNEFAYNFWSRERVKRTAVTTAEKLDNIRKVYGEAAYSTAMLKMLEVCSFEEGQ